MNGSSKWQAKELAKTVNEIGQSKHNAKAEARSGGKNTTTEIGKEIGVFSYDTLKDYIQIWKTVGEHAKSESGLRDMTKLTSEHVSAYLADKIEDGVAKATFAKYASACEKLETALSRYAESHKTGQTYKFDLAAVRHTAKTELEAFEKSRAYADPRAVIREIPNEKLNLAATLQHQGGCRVREVAQIREGQLRGLDVDKHTGREVGVFKTIGKGGSKVDVKVPVETYLRLVDAINNKDRMFKISPDALRDALKVSAAATGQDYQGSHGLRWNFAQERMDELQEKGFTYEQSLTVVSEEMGHHRSDITEHYLGK